MKILIGADHNGYTLKTHLSKWLHDNGHEVIDEGDSQLLPEDDFPEYASRVATALLAENDGSVKGILICGSGHGVCIAANRFKGIRAALCWNTEITRMSRNDDDANILCLPGRLLSTGEAENIVRVWLDTPFAGAVRFSRRIDQLDKLS